MRLIGGPRDGEETDADSGWLDCPMLCESGMYKATYIRLPEGYRFEAIVPIRTDCNERGCPTCAEINAYMRSVADEMTQQYAPAQPDPQKDGE